MSNINITFMSTCGRGMGPNLKAVKDMLLSRMKDVTFQYFVQNEKSSDSWKKREIKAAKKDFCETIEHVICQDNSIKREDEQRIKGKRFLLMNCYDYMFKNKMEAEEKTLEQKKKLIGFTHLLVTSPFCEKVLEECYDAGKQKVITNVTLPLGWDICHEEKQKRILKNLQFYYPEMKGKKILTIITVGAFKDEEEMLDVQRLKDMLDKLENDWFVLTNNRNILEVCSSLSSKYKDKLGYTGKLIQESHLLHISDALITNDGMRATCYSMRKKPVYCLNYRNNNFEKYMKKHYPDLFINDLGDFSLEDLQEKDFKSFWEEFSFPSGLDASEVICKEIQK